MTENKQEATQENSKDDSQQNSKKEKEENSNNAFNHPFIQRSIILLRENKVFAGVLFGCMLFIMALYYINVSHQAKVINVYHNKEKNYTSGRILGDYSKGIYESKRVQNNKKFKKLQEQQNELSNTLKAINERLEEISQKEKEAKEQVVKDSKEDKVTNEPKSNDVKIHKGANFSSQIFDTVKRRKSAVSRIKVKRHLINFPVISKKKKYQKDIILPSGSYVKAKLLTGVEVPQGKTFPVLAQLDYAFIGPSSTKINLIGCFLILKSTGDLSSESVHFQADKISCANKRGISFERKVNGFIADKKDNNFGVRGELNSKQGRVASMAFASSVLERLSTLITNKSPNAHADMAAKGGADAATMVAQWYLKHAENLAPTITVNSGHSIWVVMADKVSLPKKFFSSKKGGSNETIINHLF